MKLAALLSGGKDSLYAAYLAGKKHEIKYVVSIVSKNPESYMFHVPNIHLVEEQANLMGMPLIKKETMGVKEEELNDLEEVLSAISDEVDGIVTGAVESNYQKIRIDKICKNLKIKSIAPLWHKNPETLLKNMIKNKFEIIITAVAAPPLDEEWLGRKIDEECISELVELNKKYGISPVGEGGEMETLVLNCPLFRKGIRIVESERIWDEKTKSGMLEIKKIEILGK